MLLALDQGTTSSRAILFDRSGATVASAQQEFPQHYPQPGWVEHDPADLWGSQRACLERVLSDARASNTSIAALGIANQRETTLLWERETGRPLHRAIVWQDRRTAPLCDKLRAEGREPEVIERTGLRLDPYFSATKIAWLLDHVGGARAAAEAGRLCFGTVDTWLLWQLTRGRVHATDPSNASRTLLYNLADGNWDDAMLRLFAIPRSVLPEIRDTSGPFGLIAEGLPGAGLPITALVGDQQASLFGQGCLTPGRAKVTYGTGCFLLANTGATIVRSRHKLLSTVAWRIQGSTTHALEGSVFVAGAAIQWLRDELRLVSSAQEVDTLAASVRDTGGVVFVPAFAGLGTPYWDADARGLLIGMTRGTNRAHLCRAVLEAIAHQTVDILECMEADSAGEIRELRTDGGAARSDVLRQIQADLLGRHVVAGDSPEATAWGAAALAGLATGTVTLADVEERAIISRRHAPRLDPASRTTARRQWAEAVRRSLGWATDSQSAAAQ
ncbi:glycerol kinase GlpK [Nibricoccus sp. IMCC34717]|uniref:glycerol kinase GlpK n=1 Tax=Nibricoccus sp. IMCC34717 TaxID=3034021 RepID=UPI003851560D